MAATWTQIEGRPKSYQSAQALTESAPSAADEGFSLVGIAALKVILSAAAGQTLSGAGVVDVYTYDPEVERWAIYPGASFDVPTDAATHRDVVLGVISIDNPQGRMALIARGVTVSAGTVVLTTLVTVPAYLGRLPA